MVKLLVMDEKLEYALTQVIETYCALRNKDAVEKLKQMMNDSFEDDIICGESILDLNKLECIRFGSDEYEKLYTKNENNEIYKNCTLGYDMFNETDEPSKSAMFDPSKFEDYFKSTDDGFDDDGCMKKFTNY
jgi:hypothetical protein